MLSSMSDGRDRVQPLGSMHIGMGNATPERIESLQRQWVRQTRPQGLGKVFAAKLAAVRGEPSREEGENEEAAVDPRPKTVPLGLSHPGQAAIAGRTETRAGDDVVIKG